VYSPRYSRGGRRGRRLPSPPVMVNDTHTRRRLDLNFLLVTLYFLLVTVKRQSDTHLCYWFCEVDVSRRSCRFEAGDNVELWSEMPTVTDYVGSRCDCSAQCHWCCRSAPSSSTTCCRICRSRRRSLETPTFDLTLTNPNTPRNTHCLTFT